MKPAPLLVIVGETASGKSALALELAQLLDGELICADSWTVRREVNIGTAKPNTVERELVPHHLLDVVGPDEDFTAAVFKRLAVKAIADITRRGKLPILVGGTGLYVDGILFDYQFLPPGDRTAREALSSMTIDELLTRISELGLELGNVDTRNKRRLIRLIETNGATPEQSTLRENTLILGIQTDRDVIAARITKRVDDMISNGLEAEVQDLAERYGWDCEALKGVGYAQWKDYFLGTRTLQETRQSIMKATLDLAKRQRTWFKRNKSIHWIKNNTNREEIVEMITTRLDRVS